MSASAVSRRTARARLKVTRARRTFGLPGATVAVLGLTHRGLVILGRAALRPFASLCEFLTDAWLGVDTRARTESVSGIRALALGGDPEEYEPVNVLWWMRLMSAVPLDPAGATFVDLGAGRGRALILAARTGFSRVIGVELDGRLAADAEANVARWSSRRRDRRQGQVIRVMRLDAAGFVPPDGPLVVALFNPFGAETLRRVLAGISARNRVVDDEVYIAYFNPVQEHVFGEFPGFVEADRGVDWALYRLDTPARAARALPTRG
jgi:hypothetical protein